MHHQVIVGAGRGGEEKHLVPLPSNAPFWLMQTLAQQRLRYLQSRFELSW